VSVRHSAVLWNRQKRIYDGALAGLIVAYLATFSVAMALLHPDATAETILIRALGTCAFVLLHVILCIGPLARLDRRFLPLLYNRRHLGVTMFVLALAHGAFSIVQFHALGDTNPLVSVFTANSRYGSLANFPFQPLGFFALLILFLMAATSHDFWLHNLSPHFWKRIHMLVYAAYALLVGHVVFGVLQSERNPLFAVLLATGAAAVLTLHFVAARREQGIDEAPVHGRNDGLIEVCSVDDILEKRAVVVPAGGERVAVFRYDGKVSAVSNVCRHQNGPLGEGRIIDGCITCPWHGYQYQPECGASPPPFTDRIATYRTRVEDGRVYLDPRPLPAGTYVEPSFINGEVSSRRS
jgi:methionine sulfoxide reductase heme-binding subunit